MKDSIKDRGGIMKENQKNLKNYRTINLVFFLLLAILFIVTYTFILQKNYSSKTLESAEKKNIACSDTIYKTVSDFFTKEDYTEINSVLDMKSGQKHRKINTKIW